MPDHGAGRAAAIVGVMRTGPPVPTPHAISHHTGDNSSIPGARYVIVILRGAGTVTGEDHGTATPRPLHDPIPNIPTSR